MICMDKKERYYTNPVLYADYSDPDIIRVNENYYCISSSFNYFPGIPVLQSYDLVHWNLINHCVQSLPFEKYNQPIHGSGIWAPAIRYHEETFYVFFPLPDEGIFVTTAKDPAGEWSKPHCIVKAKGWIDPCPFWDDDGKSYMVFAYAKSRCGIKHKLALCEMNAEATKLLSEPVVIVDGTLTNPTAEGPKLYKKDGYYYIFSPAGGVKEGWQTVWRSKNIYGPYEYKIVMHQGNTDINGPHQGGYVSTENGENFFLHFQDVGALGRICHLQPMEWINGWPFIGQEQNGDGIGEPVKEWKISGRLTKCEEQQNGIPDSDLFDSDRLGLQWQWQANPQKEWYSLTENAGTLRLYAIENQVRKENLFWYAPNLCTQILQAQELVITAEITLHGCEDGDFCGVGMFGHCYSFIGLEYDHNKVYLKIYKGNVIEEQGLGEAEEVLFYCSNEMKNDKIRIRIQLYKNEKYEFFCSVDGVVYSGALSSFILKEGTWTGAKFAMTALNKKNRSSKGFGDISFVELKKG